MCVKGWISYENLTSDVKKKADFGVSHFPYLVSQVYCLNEGPVCYNNFPTMQRQSGLLLKDTPCWSSDENGEPVEGGSLCSLVTV